MSGSVKEIESSAYRNEFIDVLQRLVKAMPDYEELVFFVKVVKEHFLTDLKKGSPDIIVLGSNIPEELVLAAGKKHYWVLGGSRISSMWADDMVPRDTDPVSRSSLGYFKSGVAEKSLVLVPLVNDSTRKLAYMLKLMGLKVHTFHFPPLKNRDSIKEWNRQYEACRSVIDKAGPGKNHGESGAGEKTDSRISEGVSGDYERNQQNVYSGELLLCGRS